MIARTPRRPTTPDTEETAIGTLAFADGAPSKDTVEKVYDYLDWHCCVGRSRMAGGWSGDCTSG